MDIVTVKKEVLDRFLQALQKNFEVIVPLKTDVARFAPLNDPKDIFLKTNTYFPIKEYFFKKTEVLFQFDGSSITVPAFKTPKRVFFGLRKCDLNAIKHQDTVFLTDAGDPYYAAARKNSYLLGYHCETAPSQYCFCGTLNLVDFFDLMFYDKGDTFLVEIGSSKGQDLVDTYPSFFQPSPRKLTQEERKIRGADRLLKKEITKDYDHPDWQKGVKQCLSCTACTALCPTCYCFSISDETSIHDPKEGIRTREWSSCQVPEFTSVAGGHVFREKREDRFKHRIYHQLDYFKQKYGVNLCVGCGRCIEGCPTRIDFVQIINEMN